MTFRFISTKNIQGELIGLEGSYTEVDPVNFRMTPVHRGLEAKRDIDLDEYVPYKGWLKIGDVIGFTAASYETYCRKRKGAPWPHIDHETGAAVVGPFNIESSKLKKDAIIRTRKFEFEGEIMALRGMIPKGRSCRPLKPFFFWDLVSQEACITEPSHSCAWGKNLEIVQLENADILSSRLEEDEEYFGTLLDWADEWANIEDGGRVFMVAEMINASPYYYYNMSDEPYWFSSGFGHPRREIAYKLYEIKSLQKPKSLPDFLIVRI